MVTREELLAATFVQLADTLVDDFDVIELLTMLSDRCVELLEAAATGILLADRRGTLHVMAASSERAQLLELFQLQNEEGPCLDCYRSGQPVIHEDLKTANPWPRFGRVALDAGLPSVHAFPMRVRDTVVGTLNLFMVDPRPLSAADVTVAQAFAHAATIAVLQDHAARESETLTGQLQHALNSRVAIEQAKGVLAERTGLSVNEAFSRLRSYARANQLPLTVLATSLVDRTISADDLAGLVGQVGAPKSEPAR